MSILLKQEVIPFNNRFYDILSDISEFYPNVYTWYETKVIPGIVKNERKIFTEIRDNKLIGIAIIKTTPNEEKICTIKILDEYVNCGIGIRMFEKLMKEFKTSTPLVTVPEERFEEFHKIFMKHDFRLTQILTSYYRPGKKEFIYNGYLK